ncbi:MAG TPA: DUF3293 domain-containing protein [Rhodocyclaceae bacterium]
MPGRDRRRLEQAFGQTCYRGVVAGERLELRVGQACPALDSRLTEGLGWAWLTAVNPGGESLPDAENAARLASLRAVLGGTRIECWPGEAVADDGSWPAEPGIVLVNVSLAAALAIAADFGQAAILWSDGGNPARLEWPASP